jgi:ABC-type multidrug transport system ATPase subunit
MSIEACGLTKRYGDKTAVDDLTFTVRPGMVTGFLGPNGAGKTTTMRLILGLDFPTKGKVTVNGKPPGTASRRSSSPTTRAWCAPPEDQASRKHRQAMLGSLPAETRHRWWKFQPFSAAPAARAG